MHPGVLLVLVTAAAILPSLTTADGEAFLNLLTDPGEAVCLDGSPAGYYFRPGSGKNVTKSIIFLEGGGSCNSEMDCLNRSKTRLGSSNNWSPTVEFNGFLSNKEDLNPHFYDWNIFFIAYCDGGCHSGYVSKPVFVQDTPIYFRGYKIIQTIFHNLLENELKNATDVILAGCSAGGIGTYLHADYLKSILPSTVKYRAIADGGYFINVPSAAGDDVVRKRAQYIFNMQNMSIGLNPDCIKVYNGSNTFLCVGPQYVYPFIKTPIFSLNSQYDTWQIENDLLLKCNPPNCNQEQMADISDFHKDFLKASQEIVNSTINGAFLDSCFAHCQSLDNHGWSGVKIGGQTASQTFANWYFGEPGGKEIDNCPYPCNESC